MLYIEKRLSRNQDVSCNTCHGLQKFGVDGEAVSGGHRGQKGTRNAPTVPQRFVRGRRDVPGNRAGGAVAGPG